jgi:SSS family solute:Na+ symporter
MIMLVWSPCVMVGIWATSAVVGGKAVIPADFSNANAVLAVLVNKLSDPLVGGLLTAGILAAIMSSLDSQFLCLGSIFTNDIVSHYLGKDRFTDKQNLLVGRLFVIVIVAITYALAQWAGTRGVFSLGVWCFSGFASLFPLVFASLYWRRTTKWGAYASVLTAAGVWFWLFQASNYGKHDEFLFMGMTPVTSMVASSTLVLVLVSLITRPPTAATLSKFFTDKRSVA